MNKGDVNATDNIGYTALHDAAERGHVEVVKRLLEHDDINSSAVNNDGMRPDQIACRWKNQFNRKEIVTLIQSHQQQTIQTNEVAVKSSVEILGN